MRSSVVLRVNSITVEVARGTTVAAAAVLAGQACRTSVGGSPRGPLCGMGICFECRMTINGKRHLCGCQVLCESGMDVRTDD